MAGREQWLGRVETREKAKVRAIEAENADLMGEIAKLGGMLEEQEERYNASLKTIEEKDMAISQLSGKITDIKSQMTDAQREAEERTASMAAANEQMEQTVATLNATVTKKKEDLVSMQSRIVTAKSSYDHEMVRKQGEVHELEAALQQLHDYTAKMSRFTTQVQEQIRKREADMKLQLGLMKNTIAFALYIDESLTIDLTDPHTTKLLSSPLIAYPSGVTYSAATIEELQKDAESRGESHALCPQTQLPIERTVENQVVETILSRYLFKQQLTQDVLTTLRDFQQNTPQGDEDQPLEKYLQQMKGAMAERLEDLQSEQLHQMTAGYQQQVEMKTMEAKNATVEAEECRAELDKTRELFEAFKKHSISEAAAKDAELAASIDDLNAAREELTAAKSKIAELLQRVTDLTAQIASIEEAAEDDTGDLAEETTNREVNRVRKKELLALQAEVTRLTEAASKGEASSAAMQEKESEMEKLAIDLASERKLAVKLTEEQAALQEKTRTLSAELGTLQSTLDAVTELSEKQKEQLGAADLKDMEKSKGLAEAKLTIDQLMRDNNKLRSRLEAKEELMRSAQTEGAQLQTQLDELKAEGSRKDRAILMARDQALEAKQASVESDRLAQELGDEKTRLSQALMKRAADQSSLMERATRAEASAKMLQGRLKDLGVQDADTGIEQRPLRDIQKAAGVFDPLAQMPNVPALKELAETIDTTKQNLTKLTGRTEGFGGVEGSDGFLGKMFAVEKLSIDQTIPPDEDDPYGTKSAANVPLPPGKTLVRQNTPPKAGPSLRDGAPDASSYEAGSSGSGQLVIARPITPGQ